MIRNQCDGCMAGLSLDAQGYHRYLDGHVYMVCSAHRYKDAVRMSDNVPMDDHTRPNEDTFA